MTMTKSSSSLVIHRERVPRAGAGFRRLEMNTPALRELLAKTPAVSVWRGGSGVNVISTVEILEYPDGKGDAGPQWHLSITCNRERATDRQVKAVIKAFSVPRAEEDNHHPGKARHFFCPIDPTRRVDCECKESDAIVVEPDGYRWSNDRDPTLCRACEWEGNGQGGPCPLHSPFMTGLPNPPRTHGA